MNTGNITNAHFHSSWQSLIEGQENIFEASKTTLLGFITPYLWVLADFLVVVLVFLALRWAYKEIRGINDKPYR